MDNSTDFDIVPDSFKRETMNLNRIAIVEGGFDQFIGERLLEGDGTSIQSD